jgi:hypothetical protein
MTTPELRAKWRAKANARYAKQRQKIGRTVGDGIRATVIRQDPKRLRNVNYVKDAKIKVGYCMDCDLVCDDYTWMAFQWDHVDPAEKISGLAKMCKYASLEQLDAEMAKCELVCAACHALRTYYSGHHRNVVERETPQEWNLFTIG